MSITYWSDFGASKKDFPQLNTRLEPAVNDKLRALADDLGLEPTRLVRVIISLVVTGHTVSAAKLRSDRRSA